MKSLLIDHRFWLGLVLGWLLLGQLLSRAMSLVSAKKA